MKELPSSWPQLVRWAPLVLIVFAAIPGSATAESPESKNKEGNRLYAQGKYEEAEKAYLEAQGANPGKPEILYNLGNSLIKQKKFDQGVQSLRQSASNGNKSIQENSWYNAGNASFLAGKYKDSIEAYVQALRLNPADKDAKHNLELALMKLKQQETKQSKSNSNQQDSKQSDQDQARSGKDGKQQQNSNGQSGAENGKDQKPPQNSQTSQAAQRKGSISKEQALQILDALKGRELEDQQKLMERRAKQPANEKDW